MNIQLLLYRYRGFTEWFWANGSLYMLKYVKYVNHSLRGRLQIACFVWPTIPNLKIVYIDIRVRNQQIIPFGTRAEATTSAFLQFIVKPFLETFINKSSKWWGLPLSWWTIMISTFTNTLPHVLLYMSAHEDVTNRYGFCRDRVISHGAELTEDPRSRSTTAPLWCFPELTSLSGAEHCCCLLCHRRLPFL